MKSYKIAKPFDPAILRATLTAAAVPILTIRQSHALGDEKDGPALYGVVVTEDSADDATVNAAITAHVAAKSPSKTPSTETKNAALAELEKV